MKEIRWHGRGGQGAKTISRLLALAQKDGGWYVQAFPEYGPERSGAPMTAYNRSDNRPIRLHCGVTDPNYVIVLDESLLEEVDVLDGLQEDGFLLVNSTRKAEEVAEKLGFEGTLHAIEANRIARENGIQFANVVLVGAAAKALGEPALEDVKEAAEEMFGGKLSEEDLHRNMQAIEAGYNAIITNGKSKEQL